MHPSIYHIYLLHYTSIYIYIYIYIFLQRPLSTVPYNSSLQLSNSTHKRAQGQNMCLNQECNVDFLMEFYKQSSA